MLSQVLYNFFAGLFKIAVWVFVAFAAIPFSIFVLLLSFFPDFTNEADFRFWIFFASLNAIAFYFLWKPVVWIVTTITALCEGIKETDQQKLL